MTLSIPFVTATVRPLNDRFHHLIALEQAGTITEDETAELDAICGAKEGASVEPTIEVCTNCGGYYTPRKGQDYYDTRCGRCA
jgi:hypothetical protein